MRFLGNQEDRNRHKTENQFKHELDDDAALLAVKRKVDGVNFIADSAHVELMILKKVCCAFIDETAIQKHSCGAICEHNQRGNKNRSCLAKESLSVALENQAMAVIHKSK